MYRILLVDDEVLVREAVHEILESEGYLCRPAKDGYQALKMCSEEDFDLIISDIVMPDMEGIELLRRLRDTQIQSPVIIMSGNSVGIQFLKNARLLGASSELLKPFSKSELLSEVRKYLPDNIQTGE